MASATRELFLGKRKEGGYKIKRSEAKVRNEITVIQEKFAGSRVPQGPQERKPRSGMNPAQRKMDVNT